RNHFFIIISSINCWFENFHFLLGKLGSFESSDKFFGFSRKHRTTDNLYPTKLLFMIYCIFEKHFLVFFEYFSLLCIANKYIKNKGVYSKIIINNYAKSFRGRANQHCTQNSEIEKQVRSCSTSARNP